MFASPAVSADSCIVVAATLGGHVTALSVVSWLSALHCFSLDFEGNWGIVCKDLKYVGICMVSQLDFCVHACACFRERDRDGENLCG